MKLRNYISIIIAAMIFGGVLFSCQERFKTQFSLSTSSTNPYDIKFFFDQVTKGKSYETNEAALDPTMYGGEAYNEKWEEVAYETDPLILESDSVNFEDFEFQKETYIAVSKYYEPIGEEIQALKNYVERGNIAFISSFLIGQELKDSLLFFVENDFVFSFFPPFMIPDTLEVSYLKDSTLTNFLYPGHTPIIPTLDSANLFSDLAGFRVSKFDTLMFDEGGSPIILRLTMGEGRLYLCSNPIILSNYFLLHKENYKLLNLLATELELNERELLWDNFYNTLSKRRNKTESESQLWKIINQYPGFKWAFYTLIIGAVLYFLMYSRRIVQEVPILPKNKNNATAYVRTLAGVYWMRKDDNSIAHKLFHQFYEFLYLQHHVNASEVKEENINRIANKIGKSPEALRNVMVALKDYNEAKKINKEQLNRYYKYLSIFYKS